MQEIARYVDLFTSAFAFGAVVWFFFIQSPFLFKRMGRKKFVPLQMALVKILFKSLTVAIALMLTASLIQNPVVPSLHVCSAFAALVGVGLNTFLVIPRALKAGAKSMRVQDGDENDMAAFASEGGGESTALWHRLVVGCVVIMLGGL
ncbi:MAG: DUF4149 domain-containing protein, partial [Planctomycetota bacterium]